MECRKLDITIISANNLEEVRLFSLTKMRVHARVFIDGLPEKEKRTPTDTHGENNPTLTFTARYTIVESMLNNYSTILNVQLYCTSKMGDKHIGQVNISLKELFDLAAGSSDHDGGGEKGGSKVDFASAGRSAVLTLPVHVGSAQSQGALRISYVFGEKVTIATMLMAERVAALLLLSA